MAKKASAPTSAAAATTTYTGTVKASAHAEGRKTIIERDGTIETRSGGTLAWRNNNPGNIRSGNFADKNGAIDSGPGGFAVFPDGDTGNAAIEKLLKDETYRDLSVKNAIKRYAPPVENDTDAYQAAIKHSTGLDIERKISDLDDSELDKVVSAIRQHGGWKAGDVYIKE